MPETPKTLEFIALELLRSKASGLQLSDGVTRAAQDYLMKRLRSEITMLEAQETKAEQKLFQESVALIDTMQQEGACPRCD